MQEDFFDLMLTLQRLYDLLYGKNYQVSLNIYGPLDTSLGLEQSLRASVSPHAVVAGIVPSSVEEAKIEIMSCMLYAGDSGAGPIDLDVKKHEINALMNKIFSIIGLDEAEMLVEFGFRAGHPAYPVFWDFAFDIHSNGSRWIFVGSSSD